MVSVHLMITTKYNTTLNILTMLILTFIAFYVFIFVIHFSPIFNSSASMIVVFGQWRVYLDGLIVIGFNNFMDFMIYSYNLNFGDSVTGSLMIERKAKGNLDSTDDLPGSLEKHLKIYNRMNEGNADVNKKPRKIKPEKNANANKIEFDRTKL